jgi:hypothetical protein
VASTLEKLINEQVEADNLPMVEALLNSIVPLLPQKERDTLGNSLIYDALLERKPFMINTISRHFPITDAMAAGYLLDRSLFVHKDRDALPMALDALQESFGNVLISAIYRGDLEMVRTLQEKFPNRHISLSYDAGKDHLLADGQVVKHEFEAMQNMAGVPVFRELMETLLKIVQANQMDQEQFLYNFCDSVTLDDADDLTEIVPFSGQYPSIAAGQVEHPELMLAFLEAQETVLMKAMHSRLFCWVKTDEVDVLPAGVGYSPVVKASCYTEPFDIGILSTPAAFTQNMLFTKTNEDREPKPIMDQWPDLALSIEMVGSEPSKAVIYNDKIRQKTLVDSHFLGLNHPSGYTLMSMDIEVLKSLDIGKVDQDALVKAREYAQAFYCSQLLSPRFHSDMDKTARFRDGCKEMKLYNFFDFAAKSQDKEAIFNSFDQVFWYNIFHGFSAGLGAEGILEARDRFGWTNADARGGFSLDAGKINKLSDAGYVFAEQGIGVKTSYGTSTLIECALLNHKVIKMGGWPSADPRPNDVEEALKMGIRKKDFGLYATYIKIHGAEAAIQACATPAQYRYIMTLFTNDEIRPFAQQLPLKQLGDVFSRDIGL